MPFSFSNDYLSLPSRFYTQVRPTPVPAPSWLARNEALAQKLRLDLQAFSSPESLALFAGNLVPPGITPVATVYAGHQFGQPVPQLGDGRAILLGDGVGDDGIPYEIQLKGAGPTPFSRRGDGRAALGPVLREYLVSEAMFALGVPTTRALCAVTTGEPVYRQTILPGAILTRVARSHLRVGTFEYFAMAGDVAGLKDLTLYALKRLYPMETLDPLFPAKTLLSRTVDVQAHLIAHWMAFGFVHGVMNTDNCSISGETIDYGPCAFLDAYVPDRTFSSIDAYGRYGYDKQPTIGLWNLSRLAQALFPLLLDSGRSEDAAAQELREILAGFQPRFKKTYVELFRRKLGLVGTDDEGDSALISGFLDGLAKDQVDFTQSFRRLTDVAEGAPTSSLLDLFTSDMTSWLDAWLRRLDDQGTNKPLSVSMMKATNPVFIPRNHLVEATISAAIQGDLAPFHRLLGVLSRPYEVQPESIDLTLPPGEEQWDFRTFCGT